MTKSHYNKKLKPLAKKLRNDSTSGEIRLWSEVLRAKRFYGYQFNRQFPIDNYIADFICRKLKLIIEVDGRSHQFKVEADRKRDQVLNSLGYRVLRVSEGEVMNNINNVIRSIETYLPEEGLNPPSPL